MDLDVRKTCPECGKRVRSVGEPERHGVFLDQYVECVNCDWFHYESFIAPQDEPEQMEMFNMARMESE